MRFKQFLCLSILLLTMSKSFAQDHVIKANLFSPILQSVSVFYERTLTDSSSLNFGVFYTNYNNGGIYKGGGITSEYRSYFSEEGRIMGFYIAPFLRYQNLKITGSFNNARGKINVFGGGVVAGRQWIFIFSRISILF